MSRPRPAMCGRDRLPAGPWTAALSAGSWTTALVAVLALAGCDRKQEAERIGDDPAGSPHRAKLPLIPATSVTRAVTDDTASADPALRVATWNLKRLGHGTKRLELVASIIQRTDVIAVQEVMNPEAVKALIAHLPGWRYAISPDAVGRNRYVEWYAVLYRTDRVALTRSFVVDDRDDAFAREPFVACMRSNQFDFCLVNIHVIFGDRARERDAEIDALGARVRRLRDEDEGGERDWIVVGDFNRTPRARSWEALLDAGWAFAARGRVPTTIGKRGYANPYDHILIDRAVTTEAGEHAARIDFTRLLCRGDFDRCKSDVSDHAPLVLTFQTDAPDDD